MAQKIRKAVVYREVTNIINNGALGTYFYLVEPEDGKKQVLRVLDKKVVKFVVPETVVDMVVHYTANVDMGFAYDFTHREAVDCVKYWMSITKPIQMPKYLGERDDIGFCFQRLSFNYRDVAGETPVLDELLSRCTNADAVRQFIGSITIEQSSHSQYLWIYGSGGEGKGSFGRGLKSIFGTGLITMAVPRTDGQKQFLAYSLQGKRICLFPECSNFNFPNDPLFKQMTGHDDVFFEQKGKQGVSGSMNCKFIFFSNEKTGVHGADANTRRLIYSEIAKPTVKYPTSIYDGLIKSEMPSFIVKCRNLYLEKCPLNEDICFDDEKTKELLEFNEEKYQLLTEKWFIPSDFGTVTPRLLNELKDREKLSIIEYRQWIEYMRVKLGIESHSMVWPNETKKSRKWVGILAKPRDFAGNALEP